MRERALAGPLLAAALVGAAALPARAQMPAASAWRTIELEHFRVTYTAGLDSLARHAGALAEQAREALRDYLAEPPGGRVDIVLADHVDYANGYATPFPSNRIYLFARPPADALDLGYQRDWLELVIVHELAHVYHLDATSDFGRLLRGAFGRLPFAWPVFPAVGSPRWAIEGLAVAVESGVTPMGRLHGTYHDMVARTAALEDRIDDYDRLASSTPLWPGPQRVYIYGSLFLRHLQRQRGDAVVKEIVNASAGAVIPPLLWYDRVGSRVLGTPFRRAYRAWRDTATAHYRALADTIAATGPWPAPRRLAGGGGLAWYPRYSRDGRWLAYAHDDRTSMPVVRVLDARTGERAWSRPVNTPAAAAWLTADELLTSELEFRDRDHLYYQLRRLGPANATTVARGRRLQDVDIGADGRQGVAVESRGGASRLVRLDPRSGETRPLTALHRDVNWTLPRWSPDGSLIAAARWRAGGRYDVVVLDTLGRVVEEITDGIGMNLAPAWSPDGRFIVFSSDRTGIANLYAWDRRRAALRQLTSVLTGAFYPDVSPDGGTVAFSAYHYDGFHIETVPFDTAALREPLPARLPQLPAGAPVPPAPPTVAADRPYGAAGSLAPRYWMPVYQELAAGTFIGAGSGGSDLVDRHQWNAWAAVGTGGRTAGGGSYLYRGLPSLPGTALQPSLQLAFYRDWDRPSGPVRPGEPYVDEREDVLAAGTTLLHRRFRSVASLTVAGELVHRHRFLMDAPGRRLLDPRDHLIGARLGTLFSNARSYPFSISPQDGTTVRLGARQRWDRSPSTGTDQEGNRRTFDGSERELTAAAAAYLALGRVAFTNAVLALRASALARSGPGASTHGVGGTSGGAFPLGDFLDAGGSQFLPVRGFPAGTRRGTRGWSATAELRLPVAMVAAHRRALPLLPDRLSAALFADAGNASCPARLECDPLRLGPALLAAGAEARLNADILGLGALFRAGGAVPLQGTDSRRPRWYLQFGSGF